MYFFNTKKLFFFTLQNIGCSCIYAFRSSSLCLKEILSSAEPRGSGKRSHQAVSLWLFERPKHRHRTKCKSWPKLRHSNWVQMLTIRFFSYCRFTPTASNQIGVYKALLSSPNLSKVFLLPQKSPTRTMASSRDVSSQSDISKMKTEADGSFKRKPSSFRHSIEKGGKFPPEKGSMFT